MVVDGAEGKSRFGAIVKGAKLVFDDAAHLHTLVLDFTGKAFAVYELEIKS